MKVETRMSDLATAIAAHQDWIGSTDEAADLVHNHLEESAMTNIQQGTYVRDHLVEVAAMLAARLAEHLGEDAAAYDGLADEVVNEYVDRHPGASATPPNVAPLIAKARDLLPKKGAPLEAHDAARATAFATTAIAEMLWARR